MKNVPVIVQWQNQKISHLPEGRQYITVAKFSEDLVWKNEAWSVVIEFDLSPKQQGNPSRGKARFLVNNAPKDRLTKGHSFELYEGERLVAIVYIE